MFSLLAKFASLAKDWNSLQGHKVKEKNVSEPEPIKKKNFKGKVTSLNKLEEYGIINKEVYFGFNVVYASKELSVGDCVLVHAVRKEIYHAWTASYVEFIYSNSANRAVSNSSKSPEMSSVGMEHQLDHFSNHNLNNNDSESHGAVTEQMKANADRVELIEQTVSECNGHLGKLRDGTVFSVEDGETDFAPIVGDIITATVHYSDHGKVVTSWRPNQIKCIEGEITASENDCGIINHDIVFFRKFCRRKVNAYVGQKVSVMIVASQQGIFKWRAFSLCTSEEMNVDSTRKPYLSHKDGVFITEPLNFENICLGKENDFKITLQNNTVDTLTFLNYYFQNTKGVFYIGKNISSAHSIPENGSMNLVIHCKTEAIGQHEDYLLFEFSDFIIKRAVTVTIVDPMQYILKPVAPFCNRVKRQNPLDCENLVIIPGKKPYKALANFSRKLPPAHIPKPLQRAIENRTDLRIVAPCLFKDLNMNNYNLKFDTLIHLEEMQSRIDMKKFDISEAVLDRKGPFLSLEVKGLAEGRPSLIIGDKAILVPPHQTSSFAFEGYIHEVHLNEVLLQFNESFHNSYGGESFDVRFELNRTNFRRLHMCVHQVAENHEYAIFPHKLQLKNPLIELGLLNSGSKLQRYQPKVACKALIQWKNSQLNWKQKEAILRILECRSRPLPYIIFGPPGTGKTVTLVEAVIQVYENISDSRMIICTPSNSAADLIAQRLIESHLFDVSEMVRLNSYQRAVDAIPEFIKPYCEDKDSLDHVTQYRIIISTCSTAGALYSNGLISEYFTHVFIDEAGQLMEPESDIAVGFIDSETKGQVIMAGDPQQLGPVLRSSHAKTYGLQTSYLERLMNTALYARNEKEYHEYGGYNPLLITMLEESYRSHPDILHFPSDMFYFSKVICRFPTDKYYELTNWNELPHKGFPVIFHGVKGEECREQNSPSWFNPAEVVQVTKYLQKLYDFDLTPDDVGIIAPYKKQVEKIRMLLSALNLKSCKIGSVEEFQGQERRAIIISTVRSSDQYVNCDILYNLGFMSNPKRLNVAITRSQELLIVVGNPFVLSKDFFWHSFVRYCVVNGCYTGCELPLSFIHKEANNV